MYALTDREMEIVRLMARGRNFQQIADELGITRNTVRTHAGNIYRATGLHQQSAVVAWAWVSGLMKEEK